MDTPWRYLRVGSALAIGEAMKWTKLKSTIESRFAKSVRGRVEIWTTAYRKPDSVTGRGWITLDGEQIVNFGTALSWLKHGAYFHESSNTVCLKHPEVRAEERSPSNLIEEGEFSRFDLHLACWESLNMSIDDQLQSRNPLIRSLAVLDRRVGTRRLQKIDDEGEHPLVRFFIHLRRQTEPARPSQPVGHSPQSAKPIESERKSRAG